MALNPRPRDSVRRQATSIVSRVVDRYRNRRETDSGKEFDTGSIDLYLTSWMEKLSVHRISDLEDAVGSGVQIEIDGSFWLPSDLIILKQSQNAGLAKHYTATIDKQRSHNIPLEPLVTPSMFESFDYDKARELWLPLGETRRIPVGDASDPHWKLYEGLQKANFEVQEKAFKRNQSLLRKREDWMRKTGAITTDDLMRILNGWRMGRRDD